MGGFLLWLWVRNRVDLRASLDERERGVRDQVYVRSYQVLGVVWTGIIVLVSAFALLGQPITLSFEALTGVIILNAVYFPMIPTLVAAWTRAIRCPRTRNMPRGPEPSLHNRLAVLRAERSVSRQELADVLGINYQTVGYLERGEYNPSLALALQIAEYLISDGGRGHDHRCWRARLLR